MDYQERRQFLKGDKHKPTFEDQLFNLDFDRVKDPYEEYYLVDSRPFNSGGIKYYTKNKNLII